MPLPPAPNQVADELNLPRMPNLDLKKPPVAQKMAIQDTDDDDDDLASTELVSQSLTDQPKVSKSTGANGSLSAPHSAAHSAANSAANSAPNNAIAKKDGASAQAPAFSRMNNQPHSKEDNRRVKSSNPQVLKSKAASAHPSKKRLFVLDTNVLMHDPSSLFRFEEHDVYLPMTTLEELDNHKKGMSEVARNARTVSRSLDSLVDTTSGLLDEGISLDKVGHKDATGKLFFQTDLKQFKLPEGLPEGKGDNMILGVVRSLQESHPDQEVVLVSKDINMRIKARALGLPAEDYFNDQVLEDRDLLYAGVLSLPADFWPKHGKEMESWSDGKSGTMFYRITGPVVLSMMVNQFVYQENSDGSTPFYAQVKEINGKTALLQTLKDFSHQKNNVWSITARNREQNFALNLLMNPEIDFVTLLGQAGTGKTLLALASGLEQVLDSKRYNEIIITRATVPVGEDIGFLPGTEEEKMQPWMGAFDDNLEVLHRSDDSAGEWGRAATQELIRSRIKVKSMNFMRGRTFVSKFVIIDEAQNLTPKQMKTLITRAGPGTKLICLGNIAQIDTPYLTEGSSGLTYVVDRFKGWRHGGHVTLARGERSRLADHAAEIL